MDAHNCMHYVCWVVVKAVQIGNGSTTPPHPYTINQTKVPPQEHSQCITMYDTRFKESQITVVSPATYASLLADSQHSHSQFTTL